MILDKNDLKQMTAINLKLDCETKKLMWTYDFGKYFMVC